MRPDRQPDSPAAREGYVSVPDAELYYRAIGQGPPILVLHGGPDFDHRYLLPDLDCLADSFRLIYYDQRGRGQSARGVQPADVSLQSDVADLDRVRAFLRQERVALLGHSWGALLALEYALRHPARVSRLILMNAAPASRDDYLGFREARRTRAAPDLARQQALAATAAYQQGDPATVAAYYRIMYGATLRRPEHLDRLVQNLSAGFTPAGITQARAIEDRLMDETWLSSGYDLLPVLARLRIPTLLLHGDYDLVPVAYAAHIAGAIPGARFVVLPDCGHFSYLEHPAAVHAAITDFFGAADPSPA
jgi:proline iminopeptidase